MPKARLMTPGPVAVPDRVRLAMAEQVVHHRSADFGPAFHEVRAGLRSVFQTERDVLILTSSGTGAMEAAVANLFRGGDRAVVVRGGKFGERWAELCRAYRVEPVCIDVPWGEAVEPDAVASALERTPDARALLVQASETSTGAYHPIRELAELVRARGGPLLVVDGISAVGAHDLPMDAWGIDVLVAGGQKSFMIPPGLAFIALSERAEAELERADGPRYYFDLRSELACQPRGDTAFSTAVSLVAGLRESLRMILEEGLEAVFARHAWTAHAVRDAITALGLELFAPRAPSFATTAVRAPDGLDAGRVVARLRDAYGVTIAAGQGQAAGKIFRIGHLGWLDAFDMLTAIGALELALQDLGYPVKLGEGTRTLTERMRELPGLGS